MSKKQAQFKKVDTWIDIVKNEHEVLDFWKSADIFNKLRSRNKGGKKWSFLDGPMTANNPMGVHHAWGRTLKDAFQRYHAMNGEELRYQNGFDCQGLWVEVEVEKEHGFTSKQQIREYGIDKFVQDCKDRVNKCAKRITDQSIRLGYWMDWDNSYFTMSEENNYTIWSFLKKCFEKGLIYRGHDVMPWSGRSGSAYSQMEVIEGRKYIASLSLFVKYPLIDPGHEGENLVVWTTTPWTLSSNIAAAVNTELDYIKIRSNQDGEIYIFAADNLKFQRLEKQYKENWIEGVPKLKTLDQIFKERGGYEVVGTVKGADLVGLRYRGPFDDLEAQSIPGGYPFTDEKIAMSAIDAHKVIDGGRDDRGAATVTIGEGTGIVHIAPGCGDVDHVLGVKLGLPQLAPLDEAACFLPKFGFLTGMNATKDETRQAVVAELKKKNILIAQELYPHVYPHCWRTGEELVFRMVDEWYINMNWRDKIIAVAKDIEWIPAFGKDREVEWLTNMRDWMISKKRFWGLALPIWVCDECKKFDVIGGRDELKARAIEGWDEFEGHTPHKPWIDKVVLKCPHCGAKMHRIEDVGNPWLDAGIVPYSTVKYNEDRDYWKQWMPADLVLECFPGQFRNWFYSLLAMSTMMEDMKPFKTLLGHALVRDENGQQMHKSTGNAIWFDDAAEQAGADTMRWLYARQDPEINLNFGYGPLREVRGGFINTLWNTYAFFANYARLENWVYPDAPTPFDDRTLFDQWILTELQLLIKKCRHGFEHTDIRSAALAIEAFVENLSNWYVRHNRKRFWKIEENDEIKARAAFETLFECLLTVAKLVAPILPFLAESMYQNLANGALENPQESVHLEMYPTADESKIDMELRDEMAAVEAFTKLALSAREAQKLKIRQPLSKMILGPADDIGLKAARRFQNILKEDLNVKTVEILAPGTPSPLDYEIKLNFRAAGPKFGKQIKEVSAALTANHDLVIAKARAGLPVELTISTGTVSVAPDELIMQALPNPDLAIAEEAGYWTAFDTHITEDLRIEAFMRDAMRKFQLTRKEIGLEIEDRIRMTYQTNSPTLLKMFETWGDHMKQGLLCLELIQSTTPLQNAFAIEGEDMTFDIVKV